MHTITRDGAADPTSAQRRRRRSRATGIPVLALTLGGLLGATVPSYAAPAPAAVARTAGSTSAAPQHAADHAGIRRAAPIPRPPVRNAVRIVTTGMNYHVHGTVHPGAAAITWVNRDDETHMMAMARLKPGVSLAEARAALAKGEQALYKYFADPPDTAYGNPALLGPGWATTVTMDGLKKGHYLLVCFLVNDKGMQHWQMGMIDVLMVRGAARHTRPASSGTIRLTDSKIRLPRHFTGQGTYRVVNTGSRPHSISLARLRHGTSLATYFGYVGMRMATNKSIDGGPGVLVGGIDVLGPKRTGWLTLRLPRGRYGYLSTEDVTGPALPPQHGVFRVR